MTNEQGNALPKIGYVYHYPRIDEPTEKFRLDIFISSIPTEKHFDVLRCQVFVKTRRDAMERLIISHPWVYEKEEYVCPGILIMEDRKGKKEEAFTFGGKLRIIEQEMQTICILTSSGPILEISSARPLHALFIEEIEIVLAKRQARISNHFDYEALLCNAEPLELYQACIKELIGEFENMPYKNKDEEYSELLMYLHTQKQILSAAGLINSTAPSLDEIFKI
jgi:hypothetical protein